MTYKMDEVERQAILDVMGSEHPKKRSGLIVRAIKQIKVLFIRATKYPRKIK